MYMSVSECNALTCFACRKICKKAAVPVIGLLGNSTKGQALLRNGRYRFCMIWKLHRPDSSLYPNNGRPLQKGIDDGARRGSLSFGFLSRTQEACASRELAVPM